MITAREALTLTEESDAVIQKYLLAIEAVIKEKANIGKRTLDCNSDLPYMVVMHCKTPGYSNPQFTNIQQIVAAELRKHGFRVGFKTKKVTIGGGFKDISDEEPREETQHYIAIEW